MRNSFEGGFPEIIVERDVRKHFHSDELTMEKTKKEMKQIEAGESWNMSTK